MKAIFSIYFLFTTSLLVGQPLTDTWHGKIYDTNSDAIKYINVVFKMENNEPKAIIRKFDKAANKWIPIEGLKTQFMSSPTGGVLSSLRSTKTKTESETYLFTYINNKRIEVEWISQIDFLNKENTKLTKIGSGLLEPFYNGKVFENLSIGGTSTNRVSIDKVEIAENFTIVTFSYHNTSFEQVLMRLSKPGEVGAYFITSPDRSKKYYLVDKDNIAFEPNNTLVAPNCFHTFKIYFEPIPSSLTQFSILEGDPELQSGKEWNFYDIQLK